MESEEIRTSLQKRKDISAFLKAHKIDIAFGGLLIVLGIQYDFYISMIQVPIGDDAAYLTNARDWLTGNQLFEIFRPPFISWLIAGIWTLTGENWEITKFLQMAFTIGAGILLYMTLKRQKGSLFALAVSTLTMLNAQIFIYSTRILTEGLSLFFVVAMLYFLKSEKQSHWFLAGIMMALTFASRYPIILQAVVIFIVESLIRKDVKLVTRTLAGALPVITIVILAVFLKTGTFETALEKDTVLSFFLSPYYLVNSGTIWGLAFLLVPVAFLFKRTYTDKYNYAFIAWFIVSLVFWSANTTNHEFRFAIQFMPAVYYLAILAIENIARTNITLNGITSRFRSPTKNTGGKESAYA